MQGIGYILIGKEKIRVLWRTDSKTYVSLKLRKSGADGNLFSDESDFLADRPDLVERLRKGDVLKL